MGGYLAGYESMYDETLKFGLESLIGTLSVKCNQEWDYAMSYSRQVILAPQDSERRASAPWTRSCSTVLKELMKRFGPETINAARQGTASIIAHHYKGNRNAIAHVNKKASYLRHRNEVNVGAAFYPRYNPLGTGCYQVANVPVSLILSEFLPIDKAVQAAHLSNPSLCDDYGSFTQADYDIRLRLVALSAGVTYQYRGQSINFMLDGSALQAHGAGTENPLSVEAALAWRAVSGCATICSKYNFKECDLQDNLVTPMAMMGVHDIFDWRSDTAAGNHENGLSAVYGMSVENPFHTFLETLLKLSISSSRSVVDAFAAMAYMHFTVGRYDTWEYRGNHGPSCEECVTLLRSSTASASLKWMPKAPPSTYAEGDEARFLGRLWSDHFIDRGLVQEGLGWFQYLIESGRIWIFDVTTKDVDPIDDNTDWA